MLVNLVRAMVYSPPGSNAFSWMVTYWTGQGVEAEHVRHAERRYRSHMEAQLAMLAEINRLLRP